MTTLMSYHSSGGDQGRCDAKCYNADGGKCECICGGKNHGVGLEQAVDNCREFAGAWIERAAAAGQVLELAPRAAAEPLFTLAEAGL